MPRAIPASAFIEKENARTDEGINVKNGNVSKSRTEGFTLVEIIVVLVILAILAAIAVPTMLGFVEDTKYVKAESNIGLEKMSSYMAADVDLSKWEIYGDFGTNLSQAERGKQIKELMVVCYVDDTDQKKNVCYTQGLEAIFGLADGVARDVNLMLIGLILRDVLPPAP